MLIGILISSSMAWASTYKCEALCVYSIDNSGATLQKVLNSKGSDLERTFQNLKIQCDLLDYDKQGVLASIKEQTYANPQNSCVTTSLLPENN